MLFNHCLTLVYVPHGYICLFINAGNTCIWLCTQDMFIVDTCTCMFLSYICIWLCITLNCDENYSGYVYCTCIFVSYQMCPNKIVLIITKSMSKSKSKCLLLPEDYNGTVNCLHRHDCIKAYSGNTDIEYNLP